MKAGSELDALMATKVMGWRLWKAPKHSIGGDVWEAEDGGVIAPGDWSPSTDWSAAGQVAEKMTGEHFYTFTLHRATVDKDAWDAQFGALDRAFAETGPLAICLAALKAFGVNPQ